MIPSLRTALILLGLACMTGCDSCKKPDVPVTRQTAPAGSPLAALPRLLLPA